MRKLAIIAIAALVSVGLLVGCGSSGTSGDASGSAASESLAASDNALSSEASSADAASAASAAASSDAAATDAADASESAEAVAAEGQAQQASSTYEDTRERTVDPVSKPEGTLMDNYGQAVSEGGASVVDALEEDMGSGVIPAYASVYVEDSADPFVICTGADDVVNLYNAVSKVSVGEAATPSDSTYYALEFGMQNGDVADFVFTGRDTIVINDETFAISNADDLWAQIQALIDDAEE